MCDEAKAVLKEVQRDIPFLLKVIPLDPANSYYEAYREQIPVIHINGSFSFRHQVNEQTFREHLMTIAATNRESS